MSVTYYINITLINSFTAIVDKSRLLGKRPPLTLRKVDIEEYRVDTQLICQQKSTCWLRSSMMLLARYSALKDCEKYFSALKELIVK